MPRTVESSELIGQECLIACGGSDTSLRRAYALFTCLAARLELPKILNIHEVSTLELSPK